MRIRYRRAAISVTLALAVGLIVVPTVGAMYVSGEQTAVNEVGGKFKMTGGLKGTWKITKFHVKHTSPVFEAKGEEKFSGCIDIEEDRSCKGDPSGKLKFKFRYWASFADDDALHLGTCAHRIVKAKGGPTGASGFLMMVDIPISSRPGFRTHYEGVIRLGDSRHRPATPQRGVGSC